MTDGEDATTSDRSQPWAERMAPGRPLRLAVIVVIVLLGVGLIRLVAGSTNDDQEMVTIEGSLPAEPPDFLIDGTYDRDDGRGCFTVTALDGTQPWKDECFDLGRDLLKPSSGGNVFDGQYVQVLWLRPGVELVMVDVDARATQHSSGWTLIQGSPSVPLEFSVAYDGQVADCDILILEIRCIDRR